MGARFLLAVLLATACQAAPSGHSGFGSTPDITTAPASTGAGSTGVSSGSAGGTTSSGGGSASSSTGRESADGTTTTIFELALTDDDSLIVLYRATEGWRAFEAPRRP
jgi:hypothetical protein